MHYNNRFNNKVTKAFFAYCWTFLVVITLVAVPQLILTSEYTKLFIFLMILIWLMVLSIIFYKFLMLPAYDFLISDNQIKFLYEKKLAVENLNNLERIIITQYRYIFIFNDNKYIVNRIKGIFKWEKNIDPRISDLSIQYDIEVQTKGL